MNYRQRPLSSILNYFLLVTLVAVFICNVIIGRKTMDMQDSQLTLMLENEKNKLDDELKDVSISVNMLANEILFNLKDYKKLADPRFEKEFTTSVYNLLQSTLQSKKSAYTIYLRYNPELSPGLSGLFMQKEDFGVKALNPTDILAYDVNDIEHVGWYYIPVYYGTPIWMDPYQNENIDTYMISYVCPLYIEENLVGVIGIDIDLKILLKKINYIQFYDHGYAILKDRLGNQLNSKNFAVYKNTVQRDVKLENNMTLSAFVPQEELYSIRYGKTYQGIMTFLLAMMVLRITTRNFWRQYVVTPDFCKNEDFASQLG